MHGSAKPRPRRKTCQPVDAPRGVASESMPPGIPRHFERISGSPESLVLHDPCMRLGFDCNAGGGLQQSMGTLEINGSTSDERTSHTLHGHEASVPQRLPTSWRRFHRLVGSRDDSHWPWLLITGWKVQIYRPLNEPSAYTPRSCGLSAKSNFPLHDPDDV